MTKMVFGSERINQKSS